MPCTQATTSKYFLCAGMIKANVLYCTAGIQCQLAAQKQLQVIKTRAGPNLATGSHDHAQDRSRSSPDQFGSHSICNMEHAHFLFWSGR